MQKDPWLQQVLHQASPRFSPPPTPWRSTVIHSSVLALWGLLLWTGWGQTGVWSWAVGLTYISYDTALLVLVGWQAGQLLRPITSQVSPRPTTLGVIVAAHNEAAVLPVTLQALLAQQDPVDQIIIADDGSSDGTAHWLVSQMGLTTPELGDLSPPSPLHPRLHWLRLPHGGKARALNAALRHAPTDVVMTVDADTLLDPGATACVRQAFACEPALVAATGVITPVCQPTISGRVLQWFQTYEYIRNFLSRHAWMQFNSLLLVSGAFASFRRDAVVAVGGFDPDCLVEDYELIHRLHRHAQAHGLTWRVRVLGQAQARTDAPSTAMAFLRQRRRWFGGFLQTQYWYRSMVGDRRHGWLGTLMLPIKAADTLQPLYGLTAFVLLLGYLATGQLMIAGPVFAVIGLKILIDLAFHLWSVRLYRQWVGDQHRASLLEALCAAVAEPFTFQLLRHSAAAWGWWSVLTGRFKWGRQDRGGLR